MHGCKDIPFFEQLLVPIRGVEESPTETKKEEGTKLQKARRKNTAKMRKKIASYERN
jgi:hypothetical protein